MKTDIDRTAKGLPVLRLRRGKKNATASKKATSLPWQPPTDA